MTCDVVFSCEMSYFQIWKADATGAVEGGKAWIVRNKSWNGDQTPGATLSMNFHADYTANTAVPEGRAYFISANSECNGNYAASNSPSKFSVVLSHFLK